MSEAAAPSAAPTTPTAPATTQAPPQEAAKATPPELFEFKVNGRDVKMTRQELIDNASMSHAANEKFNEAKKQRTEVDRIIKTAKSNPIEALMDPALGLTKDQIRTAFENWYAKEVIEVETLSREERQMKELQEWKARREAEDQERKAREEQEAQEKMTAQQRDYLQGQIIDAIDKSGLPKTPATVARIAFYMRQNLLNGWEAPMEMIVRQVKQERQESFRNETQASTVEQVIELLGEDFVNKIRKHDLEQLRKRREAPRVESQNKYLSSNNSNERISSQEVRRRLREMASGKG